MLLPFVQWISKREQHVLFHEENIQKSPSCPIFPILVSTFSSRSFQNNTLAYIYFIATVPAVTWISRVRKLSLGNTKLLWLLHGDSQIFQFTVNNFLPHFIFSHPVRVFPITQSIMIDDVIFLYLHNFFFRWAANFFDDDSTAAIIFHAHEKRFQPSLQRRRHGYEHDWVRAWCNDGQVGK